MARSVVRSAPSARAWEEKPAGTAKDKKN